MKHISFLLFLCIPLLMSAQQGIMSAGGNASGECGSVSYSFGQVFYRLGTGAGASVAEGVQQPFEIWVVTSIAEDDIKLLFSAYPNPVRDMLFLTTDNYEAADLRWQLYDFKGKLLQNGRISEAQTAISMFGLDPAVYLLRIIDEHRVLKTFRIIKNS
jgi:hypothetical protein